jgi:hypothetical protein
MLSEQPGGEHCGLGEDNSGNQSFVRVIVTATAPAR